MLLLAQLRQNRFEALLEIAAILGTGQQCAHVERVYHAVRENFRHLAVDDLLGQTLGDGGLADAGLADVQRIILAAPAQDLNGAFDLVRPSNQRVDLAGTRAFVEVDGKDIQRAALGARAVVGLVRRRQLVLALALTGPGTATATDAAQLSTTQVLRAAPARPPRRWRRRDWILVGTLGLLGLLFVRRARRAPRDGR